MHKLGLFVVIEGIDGAGKSTQTNLLIQHIEDLDKYIDVVKTHEPWRSKEIKKKVNEDKDAYNDNFKMAELFVQDRVEHTKTVIVSNLKKGAFVLCSRYTLSTLAYQSAQGVDMEKLLKLHKGRGVLIPDLVFVFVLPVDVAFNRMKKRGASSGKFDSDRNFVKKLIDKYRLLTKMANDKEGNLPFKKVVLINANQSINMVRKQVNKAFDEVYNEWKNR
jgi:dTMP kinase